jgi:DNA-binding NtrC family response regulator
MPRIILVSATKQKEIIHALKKSDVNMVEATPENFISVLGLDPADAVVLCVDPGSERTVSILKEIKGFDDTLPVVVVGVGGLDEAVSLMKFGASDCLKFPLNVERLQIAVASAIRIYNLTKRVYLLENQMGWHGNLDDMIGHSQAIQEIFQLITTVSKSNATVLIMGESGTGKELVAKAIHRHSPRSAHPFIDINCGAIPRELLENELFGHERGSYTGADRRYIGCCERANKGTLFLDEICEMEPALQVKILRLLQERQFMRVGGTEAIKVDIRFIAATNRNMYEEVKNGTFREDLYYRLNVVPIMLPPLRSRTEDIPLLAKRFLEKFTSKNDKIFTGFDAEVIECFMKYEWPGNIRELENIVERIVVLHNDSQVKVKHLPPHLQKLATARDSAKAPVIHFGNGQKILPLDQVEKFAIEAAVAKCAGNVPEAAKQLKIGQATLYRKIKQYGLKV